MNKSILSFFLPHLDGSSFATLQIIFALVFVAAVIAIPVLLSRHARASQWERRLAALESADRQAFAHATPDELSQAVATAPERWAEALPGLLLVFGLLGTFVGLGLALSDVAGIVGGGVEASSRLSPVMDALGARFRISAWGILAFLFLRIWSTVFAYEETRRAWSAGKIAARAAQGGQKDADERQQLIDAITRSGAALLDVLQAEAQRAHVRHAELLDALSRSHPTRQDTPN